MVIELNSFVPLVTIIAAAAAPTIAAIWAEGKRSTDARHAADRADLVAMKVAEVKGTLMKTSISSDDKLEHIRQLVNSQLSEAVDRLAIATGEIIELKRIVAALEEKLHRGGLDV